MNLTTLLRSPTPRDAGEGSANDPVTVMLDRWLVLERSRRTDAEMKQISFLSFFQIQILDPPGLRVTLTAGNDVHLKGTQESHKTTYCHMMSQSYST